MIGCCKCMTIFVQTDFFILNWSGNTMAKLIYHISSRKARSGKEVQTLMAQLLDHSSAVNEEGLTDEIIEITV